MIDPRKLWRGDYPMRMPINIAFGIAVFVVSCMPVSASSRYPVDSKSSKLWFDCRSTIHDFTGRTADVGGEITSGFTVDRDTDFRILRDSVAVVISIPARTIRTGNKTRDNEMLEHLRADSFPTIDFQMASLDLNGPFVLDAPVRLRATGTVTVGGRPKDIALNTQASLLPDRAVRIRGETQLKMSDFGIVIPVLFGFIRVQDDLTVHFDIVCRPAPGEPAPPAKTP